MSALTKNFRAQKNNADFLEFLGLAGLGQAEASSLTWGDVDLITRVVSMRWLMDHRIAELPIPRHLDFP